MARSFHQCLLVLENCAVSWLKDKHQAPPHVFSKTMITPARGGGGLRLTARSP